MLGTTARAHRPRPCETGAATPRLGSSSRREVRGVGVGTGVGTGVGSEVGTAGTSVGHEGGRRCYARGPSTATPVPRRSPSAGLAPPLSRRRPELAGGAGIEWRVSQP